MEMPGRDTTFKSSYRYGFNGKEMDNEPYGQGNEYDYGFRIYNPRVGRFLSVDPLSRDYPYATPYSFAENGVISAIDLDGLERYVVTNYLDNHNLIKSTTVTTLNNAADQNAKTNMQLLLANGLVTRTDVLIRNVRPNGYTTYQRPSSLNSWQKHVLNYGKLNQPEPKSATAPIVFGGEFSLGQKLVSQRTDFPTDQFILNDRSLDVIHSDLSQSIEDVSGGFYLGTTDYVGPSGNKVVVGSFASDGPAAHEILSKIKEISNKVLNDPNTKAVTITVSGTVGLNSSADPGYYSFWLGLKNVALKLQSLLKDNGVDPSLIKINVPAPNLLMNSNQKDPPPASASITTTSSN